MGIAITLRDFLLDKGTEYDVVDHPYALTSLKIAEAAHVPGDRLAKSVLLEDEDGYLMVVVPSTHHVRLGVLNRQLQRNFRLAEESDIVRLFKDCEVGAIPPVGQAYGIKTVVDEDLVEQVDVYFEAGDHRELIHLSTSQFLELMDSADRRRFSRHI